MVMEMLALTDLRNVDLIEMIWILLSSEGIRASILSLRDIKRDVAAVKNMIGEDEPTLAEWAAFTTATGHARIERGRLMVQSLMLLVAVPFLFESSDLSAIEQFSNPAALLLIFVILVMRRNTWLAVKVRRTVRDLILSRRNGHDSGGEV